MAEDEEDDYLSMAFTTDQGAISKESSLQRTARLKKEALERGRPPSKAELVAQEKASRDAALATALDNSNKGAQMMAKMGFKGGALGKSEDARTQPIELQMKDDRGGIGMDSEKKRKVREAADAVGEGEKRQKVGMDEFRERNRSDREGKRAEGMWWGAMKVLEGLEEGGVASEGGEDGVEVRVVRAAKRLRDVNVLYRPLLKTRLEKERDRKIRYDLNNSLSTRNNDSDSDGGEAKDPAFDKRLEDLEEEDVELEEYENLGFAERLEKVVGELREKYHYCFWCKYQYPDAEMEGCPGLTEDEHG
jgi:hypothetical protein